MIELKITGTDVKDFWTQSANALALILNGGRSAFPAGATPGQGAQQPASEDAADDAPQTATPVGNSTKMVEETTAGKRGQRRKPPVTIEGKAEKTPELPKGGDAVPDMTGEITVDTIRGRVREIIEAHTARGNDMPACVAYVQRLFKPFGIDQAAKCPPAKFAAFLKASEPYLAGTAA